MLRAPLASGTTSSWLPMLPPIDTSFWKGERLHNHIRNVQDTIDLLKAVQKELETVLLAKGSNDLLKEVDNTSSQSSENNLGSSLIVSEVPDVYQSSINGHRAVGILLEMVKAKSINLSMQESLSLEAANSLLSILKSQLALFNSITNENGSWQEKSAAVKLVNKLLKSKRNKSWRKKRRKQVAEMLCKKHEMYEQADRDADEWRAREIAKDIAKHKVEKMKAIAKDKAKEDRKKLEFELELVLIVEKLKELRSIRIQKLKKQGHFLPEEDDKFLERVRAAVEEEERYAAAAADTDAAKDAIATAEESRKTVQATRPNTKDGTNDRSEATKDYLTGAENGQTSCGASNSDSEQKGSEGQSGGGYDSVGNLPVEFYHYYHGSNTDMGTLIEVRRTWDAFIRPGGSRIPGHWIQPPPPSNEIWASYLVTPKE